MSALWPKPQVVQVKPADSRHRDDNHHQEVEHRFVMRAYVEHRGDVERIAASLGMVPDDVRSVIESEGFQAEYRKTIEQPALILPSHLEMYVALTQIAMGSQHKPAERLKALKQISDIKGPPDNTASLNELAAGQDGQHPLREAV